jgi:predicted amidohydrolase
MLRIAVAQTPGNRLDEWPKVCELTEELIERAASENADVVLLPECLWPAYFLGSTDEYFAARDAGMPGDRWFLAQLGTWARTHRIAVCTGYVTEQERRLFNAACLISETGEMLGTYYKCFLWDFDHAFFEAGNAITTVDTRWGPVGLMICADARLPEIPATLAARGARLILQPTAWVNVGTPQRLWNPQPELFVPERAREFGIPIASASKWGIESGTTFVGSSLICDAAGNMLVRCGTRDTRVVVAEVTPRPPQPAQLTTEQRTRLLAAEPPELPTADVPPLSVVLLKDRAECGAALDARPSASASRPAVPTLFLLLPKDAPSGAAIVEQGDKWLLLAGPIDGVCRLGAARLAAVRDRDAAGFAPIRALAFEGIHLVVVFGEGVSARTLRARAAENRIFLVHATSAGLIAYDPRGEPAGTATPYDRAPRDAPPKAAALELDLARATDKEFAPHTNPFTGRKPELYDF